MSELQLKYLGLLTAARCAVAALHYVLQLASCNTRICYKQATWQRATLRESYYFSSLGRGRKARRGGRGSISSERGGLYSRYYCTESSAFFSRPDIFRLHALHRESVCRSPLTRRGRHGRASACGARSGHHNVHCGRVALAALAAFMIW
eukprot:scaffold100382_cov60-Phaeocystis_antarctica.AAC.2